MPAISLSYSNAKWCIWAGNMATIILLPTSWNAAAVLSLLSPTTNITRMGTLDGSSVQMSWLNSLH